MQVSTNIFNEQSISGFNRLNAEIQDDQRRIATGLEFCRRLMIL